MSLRVPAVGTDAPTARTGGDGTTSSTSCIHSIPSPPAARARRSPDPGTACLPSAHRPLFPAKPADTLPAPAAAETGPRHGKCFALQIPGQPGIQDFAHGTADEGEHLDSIGADRSQHGS